jgi:ABC-type branched-subunit amino acid transport system ATPase component
MGASVTALLRIEGVSRHFGHLRALHGVTAEVQEGEIRGLIGPNGAGKTTLINVLTGFLAPTAGRVYLAGERLDRKPAHVRVRSGLGRTFQTPQLCTAMSVRDNIVVGAHQRLGTARFTSVLTRRAAGLARLRAEADDVARRLGLGEVLDVPAGALSYGHMRLLEISRALMGEPRLLLLDEPVAGMNEAESAQVGAIVRELGKGGTTVLLVEHDMTFVMSVCERLTVLNYGELLAEGTPAEIQRNPEVEAVYLGRRRT